MTDEQLQAIRARLESATPGPWRIAVHDYSMADIHSVTEKYGDMNPVLSVSPCRSCQAREAKAAKKESRQPEWKWKRCTVGSEVDWQFIANAPTDIAALLDEVERLRTSIELCSGSCGFEYDRHLGKGP